MLAQPFRDVNSDRRNRRGRYEKRDKNGPFHLVRAAFIGRIRNYRPRSRGSSVSRKFQSDGNVFDPLC